MKKEEIIDWLVERIESIRTMPYENEEQMAQTDAEQLLGISLEKYNETNNKLEELGKQEKEFRDKWNLEKENAAFEGNEKIGKMYADLADINYQNFENQLDTI